MNRKIITLALATCLAAAAGLAQEAAKAPAKKSMHHAAPKPVIMPAADLKWSDMTGAPGVKVVDLWGNHEKGAYGGFVKFPAGWSSPLHTHTYEMRIAVISGTFVHTPDGKDPVKLGPGSYLKQPGDGYKHSTACDQASECVIFIESAGKFDLKPVAEAKAPEKK